MPERGFEPMTKIEVVTAQSASAKCVTDQDVEGLLDLYDFGDPDEPLLFKPTLADVMRLDEKGAKAYFVGGDPDYFQDSAYGRQSSSNAPSDLYSKQVVLDTKAWVTKGALNATRADDTFACHKLEGRVLISLHHSSLTWFPPIDD